MPSSSAFGVNSGHPFLGLERDGEEGAAEDRRVDARTLTGGVLVGVHGRDGLVAGGHCGQPAVTPERHADPVGPSHGGPGQLDHQPQGGVDQIAVGRMAPDALGRVRGGHQATVLADG